MLCAVPSASGGYKMFATIHKILFIIHHLVPRLGLGVEATIRPEPRNINHAGVRVFYVRALEFPPIINIL